jgi:hypothetical protein
MQSRAVCAMECPAIRASVRAWLMRHLQRLILPIILLTLLAAVSTPPASTDSNSLATVSENHVTYWPLVLVNDPWQSPFGVEPSATRNIQNATIREHAAALGLGWIRLNDVSWQVVQPEQGGPYNWGALAGFERNLLAANQLGMRPVVVVRDSPTWATINVPVPMPCGAIRADRFADFAIFMSALVTRYSQPPYNVHHWELGNEPDTDPHLIPPGMQYGCWGNIWDPYYGGEHYGAMLTVVSPAIRAADPRAKILIGGLLLDTPQTTVPGFGNPERFLEGILRAGAAPHFDIVPYHAHSAYYGSQGDYSGLDGNNWAAWGGPAKGKPAFLRQVMARYGVSKPLWFNEASLGCPETYAFCAPPSAVFFQAQADHVPRMMARSLAAGAEAVFWFALNDPDWRASGLLDRSRNPRPAYRAYQALIENVRGASLPPISVDYGPGVEAYRFHKRSGEAVDVLWSVKGSPIPVTVHASAFVAAFSQEGDPLPVVRDSGVVRLNTGFSAIYMQLVH